MIEAKSKQDRRLDVLQHQVNVLIAASVEQDDKIKELEEKVKDLELDISSVDLQGLNIEIDKGRAFSKNWSIDLIDRWEFETLEERVQRLEG